ncbi:MAG: hypothetical protein U9R72_02870 [Chloroflexota bacterium]|nr:hypothetical protein [Chloroflexota bacterium]
MIPCTLESFDIGSYTFQVILDTGMEVGGDVGVSISDASGKHLLDRIFYFGGRPDHVRAFARKFARSPTYREACRKGTTHWARLDRWYRQNESVYASRLGTGQIAAPAESAAETRREMRRLYELLNRHLQQLEAQPAYRDRLATERESPDPSADGVDPEIERAVRLLDAIAGVAIRSSCQGIRHSTHLDEWEHGPIWFPSRHQVLAHVQFASQPDELAADLDAFLQSEGVGRCQGLQARAAKPEDNAAFVEAVERFASRVE